MNNLCREILTIIVILLMGASASANPLEELDPNIETALVTYYGVFFLENHNPTDFFNSEDPEERFTIQQFLEASEGQQLEVVINESIESLDFKTDGRGNFLVNFNVPGGEIYYTCHSHDDPFLGASRNHCSACVIGESINNIILSDEDEFKFRNRRCIFSPMTGAQDNE